jgi:hypothetical protein
MPVITVADIQAMQFGYLAGSDLTDFLSSQTLITQETVTPGLLQRMVTKAYAKIISQLSAKCQIATELKKTAPPYPQTTPPTADTRSQTIVEIVTLLACENIVSRVPGLPEALKNKFATMHQLILDIRNGQAAIPDVPFEAASPADNRNISRSRIVGNSFKTLG